MDSASCKYACDDIFTKRNIFRDNNISVVCSFDKHIENIFTSSEFWEIVRFCMYFATGQNGKTFQTSRQKKKQLQRKKT